MRKLAYLAFGLLLAAACTQKIIIVTSPCNFDVSLEEIRGTKVWVKVVPENPDATYAISVIPASDPSYDKSDNALAAEQIAYMKSVF